MSKTDFENVIKEINDGILFAESRGYGGIADTMKKTLSLLNEQEEKIENLKQTCQSMMEGACLLKEQEAKPSVHIHEEYPEHDWERDKNGDIDNFAYNVDYHNGPACKRCNYAFCIHCDPDGWNKKPCIIDRYKCPKCGRYIIRNTKFCSECGQAVKWND